MNALKMLAQHLDKPGIGAFFAVRTAITNDMLLLDSKILLCQNGAISSGRFGSRLKFAKAMGFLMAFLRGHFEVPPSNGRCRKNAPVNLTGLPIVGGKC